MAGYREDDLMFPAAWVANCRAAFQCRIGHTTGTRTRPELFSIDAGLPRRLADGMSVGVPSHKPTYQYLSAGLVVCLRPAEAINTPKGLESFFY
jgi:hypothetical protein